MSTSCTVRARSRHRSSPSCVTHASWGMPHHIIVASRTRIGFSATGRCAVRTNRRVPGTAPRTTYRAACSVGRCCRRLSGPQRHSTRRRVHLAGCDGHEAPTTGRVTDPALSPGCRAVELSRLRRAALEAAVEVLSRPCLSSLSSSCRVSCRGQSHDEEPPRHSNGSERRRTAGSARTGYLLPKKEGDAEREPRIRECSDLLSPITSRLLIEIWARGGSRREEPQGHSIGWPFSPSSPNFQLAKYGHLGSQWNLSFRWSRNAVCVVWVDLSWGACGMTDRWVIPHLHGTPQSVCPTRRGTSLAGNCSSSMASSASSSSSSNLASGLLNLVQPHAGMTVSAPCRATKQAARLADVHLKSEDVIGR